MKVPILDLPKTHVELVQLEQVMKVQDLKINYRDITIKYKPLPFATMA